MPALVYRDGGTGLEQVPKPLPEPGEVAVQVLCAGLCRTDVYAADGLLRTASGRVLGHEFCGQVSSLGEGVEQGLKGRRVAVFPWLGCADCAHCRESIEGHARCPKRRFLGVDLDGAFAAEICVPAHRVVTIADGVTDRAAAYAEPVAAALGSESLVPPGATVAVFGDNRIGVLTTRLLHNAGRRVVPPSHGALDFAVEARGDSENIERAMQALRHGGTLVVKSRPAGPVGWPLRLQVEKELRVVGAGYGSFQRALRLLRERPCLFSDLWETPVSLGQWPAIFERERAGLETRKAFFLPEPAE